MEAWETALASPLTRLHLSAMAIYSLQGTGRGFWMYFV